MRKITVSGKTVDEAISQALQQLQTTQDKVTITVVEEPVKGLFGLFGGRLATVEVEEKPDAIAESQQFLESVINKMSRDVEIDTIIQDGEATFNLMGKDLGILIGRRGQTLDALQYLTNVVANRKSDQRLRIILDAENYREKRKQSLEELADRLSQRVLRIGKPVRLEPMTALERKIIHTHLQDHQFITTHSEGTEPNRYIVISHKK